MGACRRSRKEAGCGSKLGGEGKSINMSPGEDHLCDLKEPLEQVADAGAGRTRWR